MEERECEIVFVSNKSQKKKENILEALAKYKLKQREQKQHEHTIKTKAGSSKENETMNDFQPLPVECKASKETSKGRKGQEISLTKQSSSKSLEKSQITEVNEEQHHPIPWQYDENERNKLQMEYVQHLAKSENKPYLKNDFEIGITEYISQGKGFSADVNQSYLDFQVHEISLDGSVVHLTNMLNPLFKPNASDGKCVITYELLNNIEDIMLKSDEEIKSIEIDITEMDNIDRINLRKILKENENYYVHEPVSVCGKLILKICRMHDERHPQNGLFDYVQFVLHAEKISTKTAIHDIAKKLRKSSACFMTAENKCARSISQLVTVKSEDSIGLCLASLHNISIGNFSFVPQPLQLGDLKGNHFNIALRKVIGNKGHIEASFRSLKDNGFINYYDNHQFGFIKDVPKHLIGKQLLLKQWQEAIDLILQPPELNSTNKRLSNLTLACIEYKFSRLVHKTFDENQLNGSFKAKLLSSIKIHGENLVEAVNAVPLELRLSFVRAYQCFLWNTIVSKRLAKFGAKLIVGDLVYAPGDSGRFDNNRQHNQREVIFIDKNNIHKYTIYDVVLPLPGCNITYPANEVADWYKDLLLADGLLEKDFNSGLNTYGINGAYRPLVLRPSDLKWKFVHYDNPDQSLIPSDLDRLQQIELPSDSSQEGAYLGLVLEFSLPAFAWGTMALREILKVDIIAELRNSFSAEAHLVKNNLKNKVRLNVSCLRQERPSPSATNKALKEPQMKKRKEKPCIADQPLSETSNSLLDTHRNRSESAASQLSNGHTLREMKLKSSIIEKQPSMDNESFEGPLRTKRIAEKQAANKKLVKQRKNQDCSPSTTESWESQLKGITLQPATLDNPPPTTREPFKKPQLKKLKKNRIVLEPSTCQKPPPTVNKSLKEPQTNFKVEPGICQTHSSTFTESCEEPEKKKIKLDLDTDEEEEVLIIQSCKSTKFKSIMYVDLISEQED